MTKGETFYDIFGVSSGASQQQIRAAYVRLMKANHPDLNRSGPSTAKPDLVPLLNRSYAVLKDVRLRAQYDRQLASRMPRSFTPPPVRYLSHRGHTPSAGPGPRAFFLIASAACVVLFGLVQSWEPIQQLSRAATRPGSVELLGDLPMPRDADIRRQVQLATSVSDRGALSFSSRCFTAALQNEDVAAAELCVVFDDAFLYWRRMPSGWPGGSLYFRDEVVRDRHSSALSSYGANADMRLHDLQEASFRALLANVSASSAPGSSLLNNAAPSSANAPSSTGSATNLAQSGTGDARNSD